MVSSACVSGELYAFELISNMQHGAKCTRIASTWFGTTVYTDVHVNKLDHQVLDRSRFKNRVQAVEMGLITG